MSRAYCTRSVEPATSSAPEPSSAPTPPAPEPSPTPEARRLRTPLSRLPIRLRLAVSVSAVTFLMLVVFGMAVRDLTARRLRSNFDSQVIAQAGNLASDVHPGFGSRGLGISNAELSYFEVGGGAVRMYYLDGTAATASTGPYLGSPTPDPTPNGYRADTVNGYRVVTEAPVYGNGDSLLIQYGLSTASLNSEIANLDLLVLLGVLAGTALAFGAGWLVARRAITPIAELTAAASEIERTGDPTRTLPEPTADDEVAELSRTLATMLSSLSDARARTESALDRQRLFVADASHELRTPLTSVLANLELLEDSLSGPERELARSALRSTQRMRRLVADLLLLARSDVKQQRASGPLDLADLVVAAASELEPTSDDHVLTLDVEPTPLVGSADDLQRVAINLVENAIRHTPPGTHITATTRLLPDGQAELTVADDGPGIPPAIKEHLFERFVRGGGESGGSFGLGLAIVEAVTQAHGGTVTVKSTRRTGTRFVVRLPTHAPAPAAQDEHEALAASATS
jgi:two-component system, OmpR family, sensor kinase